MTAISVLFVVVFAYFTWRARAAGRGAFTRGGVALFVAGVLAVGAPVLLAKETTRVALASHGDWWTSNAEGWFAGASRSLAEAMARSLGHDAVASAVDASGDGSSDDVAPVALLADGSGGPPEEGSGTADGPVDVGVVVDGVSDPRASQPDAGADVGARPAPRSTLLRHAEDAVAESVRSALLRPELQDEAADAEAAGSDKPPQPLEAIGTADGTIDGAVVDGAVVDGLGVAAGGATAGSSARPVAIPAVAPVLSSAGVPIWPTPSVPHASAMTAPPSATRSLATLSSWVGLEGSSDVERIRIAHDWLALHIAVAPSDPDAVLTPVARQQRAEIARAALTEGRADSLGFAALLAEVLAPLGIDARMVIGGTPDEAARGAWPRAWSAVRVQGQWLTVNVAEAAGCVPSERCATPYSAAYLFAPPQAAVRHHIPAPGAELIYGDVDRRALLRGPDLEAGFFAAGFALVGPATATAPVVDGAAEVAVMCGGQTMVRATVWDSSTASSVTCTLARAGDLCRFSCPAAGVAGGRVRLLGMGSSAWVWSELAAWDVAPL